MKKFIIKILILFFIVFIIDRAIGYAMNNIINNIDVGGMARDNYICNEADEDILIYGSSRAVHHYNAAMLEDSLGLSCYNCGDDGNGVILNYGRFIMCKQRKLPKLIIFDVTPEFDLLKNNNNKYLGWLRSRYDYEGINDIFDKIDTSEKYKMYSYMYRYNTRFLQNIFVFVTQISTHTGYKGFRPLSGVMDSLKIVKNNQPKKNVLQLDSTKWFFMHQFINASEGSKLIFVQSPIWYGADSTRIAPLLDLCQEKNIVFLDFSNNPKYVHNNKYFKDGTHLNSVGADEFTNDLICVLKRDILN